MSRRFGLNPTRQSKHENLDCHLRYGLGYDRIRDLLGCCVDEFVNHSTRWAGCRGKGRRRCSQTRLAFNISTATGPIRSSRCVPWCKNAAPRCVNAPQSRQAVCRAPMLAQVAHVDQRPTRRPHTSEPRRRGKTSASALSQVAWRQIQKTQPTTVIARSWRGSSQPRQQDITVIALPSNSVGWVAGKGPRIY